MQLLASGLRRRPLTLPREWRTGCATRRNHCLTPPAESRPIHVRNNNAKRDAADRYPKKAGRPEDHHIRPKYLGGGNEPNNIQQGLDGAYHQLITNEFRKEAPYGQGVPEDVEDIIERVYKKLPLPPEGCK